jgi:hypothetical protein
VSKKRHTSITPIVIALSVYRCSNPSTHTQEMTPFPKLPEVPNYTQLPHPEGFDLTDLQAIFHTHGAPKRESLIHCDNDLRLLLDRTKSRTEAEKGARELVTNGPEQMHWCFYDQIIRSQEDAQTKDLLLDRQKSVVFYFRFLTPIANGFRIEFNDTRYLRWAIHHYQNLSNWLFYRSLVLKPDSVDNLLSGVNNSHALFKKPSILEAGQQTVLGKYKLESETANMGLPPLDESMQQELTELEKTVEKTAEKIAETPPSTPVPTPTPARVPAAKLEEIPVESSETQGDYFDSE